MAEHNLIHLKAKRLLSHLYSRYHTHIQNMSEAAGCGKYFWHNFVYILTARKKGTIIPKLGQFCRYYGIDIRYLADDTLPVHAPFLEPDASDFTLMDLSCHLVRKETPELFGAIVGWFVSRVAARMSGSAHTSYSLSSESPRIIYLNLKTGILRSQLEFEWREDNTVWVKTTFIDRPAPEAGASILSAHYMEAWIKQLKRKLRQLEQRQITTEQGDTSPGDPETDKDGTGPTGG